MKLLLAVSFLVILGFPYGRSFVAPVLSVCSRNDPNLEQCIINVVERIKPNVAAGDYGDGRAAPKMDPVFFKRLDITNGPGLQLNLTDVTIAGNSKFEVKRIRYNLDQRQFNITAVIPTLTIDGQYDLSMNILLMRAVGKGDFHLTLTDTVANLKMEYQVVPRGGKNYVRFNPIEMKLRFPKARFDLTGLFNGDKELEAFGNRAINENPNLLLDEVKPVFEKQLARIFTDISNSVVEGAEESELLPP
ncbi:conserved hypothetical protein [Culex quinquefasciatus]|uniref:Hemolymph juvenile hormone binding protein n=1 Tax=Culex quinquefasciatus TaxID=7176 RepID=B0X3U3_CULQU|nr:uncharacterized protein LOC6047231 [Culex quinquefasciatus]EDS40020.1 conserved hypothetical protein [Culex quinquefasciatus]|eukprot:XP_001864315.1 conserved hypothetical protein [Culex quinquefasciatus]